MISVITFCAVNAQLSTERPKPKPGRQRPLLGRSRCKKSWPNKSGRCDRDTPVLTWAAECSHGWFLFLTVLLVQIRQLKAQLVQPKEPKDRVQQEARAIPQEPEFAPDPTLLQLSDLFDVFQMEPSEAEPELKSGHVPSDPSQQQAPTEPVAQMPQAPRALCFDFVCA